MPTQLPTKPRVRERKLGRERAVGLYWQGEALVEIDPRQKSKAYLDTLLHELLHHACPTRGETWVKKTASLFTHAVWKAGFRKVAH